MRAQKEPGLIGMSNQPTTGQTGEEDSPIPNKSPYQLELRVYPKNPAVNQFPDVFRASLATRHRQKPIFPIRQGGCRTKKSRILAERVFFWLVYCLVTRQNY
jgi:hypothetical protein